MNKLFFLAFFLFNGIIAKSQNDPTEVTPKMLTQIKGEIEKQITALKKELSEQDFTKEQIEFSKDTFYIEQLASKRLEIDFTNYGMRKAQGELRNSYDKLLNK